MVICRIFRTLKSLPELAIGRSRQWTNLQVSTSHPFFYFDFKIKKHWNWSFFLPEQCDHCKRDLTEEGCTAFGKVSFFASYCPSFALLFNNCKIDHDCESNHLKLTFGNVSFFASCCPRIALLFNNCNIHLDYESHHLKLTFGNVSFSASYV